MTNRSNAHPKESQREEATEASDFGLAQERAWLQAQISEEIARLRRAREEAERLIEAGRRRHQIDGGAGDRPHEREVM